MTQRSRHRALVDNNNDPEKLGRIQVKCQSLVGYETVIPIWVEPFPLMSTKQTDGSRLGAMFFIPEVGSEVEIEVLDSLDTDEMMGESCLVTPDMRYYPPPFSAGTPVPSEFQTNYPARCGIKTSAGHILLFDNTDGSEELTVIGNFGSAAQTVIRLTKDTITITNESATMTLSVKQLNIGTGADDHIVRGEDLLSALASGYKAIFDAHVQQFVGVPPGVTSVTLPPTTPFTDIPGSVLSPNHKVK